MKPLATTPTYVPIEKGTVATPVLGRHRDAEFYPEPDKFIPEHFHPGNYKSFEKILTYL